MKNFIVQIWAIVVLALIVPLTSLDAASSSSSDLQHQTELQRQSKPALWRMRQQDSTVYLFGSVAALCPNEGWFTGKIKEAFEESSEIVVEVDTADASKSVPKLGIFTDGRKLSQVIGPKLNQQFYAALNIHSIKSPSLDALRPWLAANTLQAQSLQNSCYSSVYGVEEILTKAATQRKMRTSYLDTFDDQMGIFANLSEPQQIEYLRYAISNSLTAASETDSLVESWRAGHPENLPAKFGALFVELPWFREPLLINPNRKWAAKIHDRIKQPGVTFVAVTAGHLAGDNSILQLLQKMGYQIERIQ